MRAGDVVWNPLTGEKAMLVEPAEETEGARIVVDFAVEAGGFVPGGEHVHDHCSEHFEVRSGRIAFLLGGEQRVLEPGEQLTVPPGTWHRWWNPGEDEVVTRVRVEPALRFEEAILAFWGLCADGHTNREGRPSPLYGALLATRYRAELRYRQPPDIVQRLMFPPLAALARRRGLARKRSLPRPHHAPGSATRSRAAARARDGESGAALVRREAVEQRRAKTSSLRPAVDHESTDHCDVLLDNRGVNDPDRCLRLTTEAGASWDDPSEDALAEFMGDLGPSNTWLVVTRLGGPNEGDKTRLTFSGRPECFDVEVCERAGVFTSRGLTFEVAQEVLTRWSFELPDWDAGVSCDPPRATASSSSEDEPEVLSIGAILGDSDAENMAWKRAISALRDPVRSHRSRVSSPLRLNVVFHVNGRLVPNEFEGIRTGRFDKERRHLVVQAAVPDEPTDDRGAVLLDLLQASIDEAERFARSKGVADTLPELRALIEHLR